MLEWAIIEAVKIYDLKILCNCEVIRRQVPDIYCWQCTSGPRCILLYYVSGHEFLSLVGCFGCEFLSKVFDVH